MADLKTNPLSTNDVRALVEERDQLQAEVAKLRLILEHTTARVELLKEASYQTLEYLATPNPYGEPAKERNKAILRLEDALAVNGCRVVRFEVKSDAN